MPEITLLPNLFSTDYDKIDSDVFAQVRQMGFRTLELGATSKPFSKDLIKRLRELEFTFLAHGSNLGTMSQGIEPFIEEALKRGEHYLVCYWPWLTSADQVDAERCQQSVELLNRLGETCERAGLKFAFHNHDVEFKKIGDSTVMDVLLKGTNPEWVSLELDIYHMVNAKVDPLPFLQTYSNRIEILHLNTMDNMGPNPVVGDGIERFSDILNLAAAPYWVIEAHGQFEPLRYLKESYFRLTTLTTDASNSEVT